MCLYLMYFVHDMDKKRDDVPTNHLSSSVRLFVAYAWNKMKIKKYQTVKIVPKSNKNSRRKSQNRIT